MLIYMTSKIFIERLNQVLKISLFVTPFLTYIVCRYIENFLNAISFLSGINLNELLQMRLNDLYVLRYSLPLIIIFIIGFLYILSNLILNYKKQNHKLTSMFKNFLVLFLTILIFLFIFNFIIQKFDLVTKSNLEKFQNDTNGYIPFSETIFYGSDTKLKPTHIKINSYGFRDYEYSFNKSSNTFRIIGLGDSHTFGWGVELDETYLKLLEKKLNENSKIKYEVLNLGVVGFNTRQEVELFKTKGLELNPDLIIIGFVVDDVTESIPPPFTDKLILDFKNSKIPLLRWISLKLETYIIVKNNQLVYSHLEEYFDKNVKIPLIELSQITNVPVMFVIFSYDERIKDRLNALIRQLNFHAIYTNDYYKNYDKSLLVFGGKDSHPTPLVHIIVSNATYNFLKENKLVL